MTEVIVQAVQSYYDQVRQPKYEPTEFRLSESGDCPRKRVLVALGRPATHPPTQQALQAMEAGNVWEAWLVDRLRATGRVLDAQVRVEAPYHSSGHIDVLLQDDPVPVPVEIKACSQWAKDLPEQRHVKQVQAYLHFYGRHHGITMGQLVYMFRENGAGPFVYDVEHDPEVGEEIEAELRALRSYVDTNRVPEIPAGMVATQFPCSWTSRNGGGFCTMYGHCWGGHGHG